MSDADEIASWSAKAPRLLTVLRGEESETVHAGMACLVDARGNLRWSIGSTEARVFFRSAAKPLQALPVLTSGAADACHFQERDLAILCGSHSGGPEQISQVSSMLAKSGLREAELGCGGGLRDMCSGKHTGMLAGCMHLGLSRHDYLDANHPWQKRILDTIGNYCGIPTNEIRRAEDGCSAPTFSLPLYNIALGYARLAEESRAASPAQRLLENMRMHPGGHTGEPDLRGFTEVGNMISKSGADGIFCVALPEQGLGFALKIIDGASLPRWPILTQALLRMGLISPSTANCMEQALWTKITSRRGKEIGKVRIEF